MNLTYMIMFIVIAIALIAIVVWIIGRKMDKNEALASQKRADYLLRRRELEQKSAATTLEGKLRACNSATSFQKKLTAYTNALDYLHDDKNWKGFSDETDASARKATEMLKQEFETLITERAEVLAIAAPTSKEAFDELWKLMMDSRKKHNNGLGYYVRTWGIRYGLAKLAPPTNWKNLVHHYYQTPHFSLYCYDDRIPANQATLWAAEAIRKNDPVQAKFLLALSKVRDGGSIGSAAAELGEVTCLELAKIVELDQASRHDASTDHVSQN